MLGKQTRVGAVYGDSELKPAADAVPGRRTQVQMRYGDAPAASDRGASSRPPASDHVEVAPSRPPPAANDHPAECGGADCASVSAAPGSDKTSSPSPEAAASAASGEASAPVAQREDPEAQARHRSEQLEHALAKVSPTQAAQVAVAGQASALPYQAELEKQFSTSLSDVKAHVGTPEAKLGLAMMSAEAATVGRQVAFASTNPSKEVVAHELTHVVQQRAGAETAAGAPGAALSTPGHAAEREASRVGAAAPTGAALDIQEPAPAGTIHRSLLGSIIGGVIGAVGGAITGGLLGGPVGAIIGGVVGAVGGAAIGGAVSGGGAPAAPATPAPTPAPRGATTGTGAAVAASFNAKRVAFPGAPSFGMVSWNANNPIATYAAYVDGTNWRFRLETLNLDVPVGVAAGGRIDVPSAAAPVVTKPEWPTVESDLKPSGGTPNRSPRTKYWAQDLTWTHEIFHFDEFNTFLRASFGTFETTIEGAGYTDAIHASDNEAAALARKRADLDARMIAAWNQAKTNMAPGMEDRAYADGAANYQARADAVRARAVAEGWI